MTRKTRYTTLSTRAPGTIMAVFCLALGLGLQAPGHAPSQHFAFHRIYVDVDYGGNGRPGWALSGDVDNDGDTDIIAGGGSALFVYENDGDARGWSRHGNLDASGSIGSNGAVIADVDSDGDLDIVSAKFYDDIGWWENPCGSDPCSLGAATSWDFHAIGEVGTNGQSGPHFYLHDIAAIDFDGNPATLEIVTPVISKTCGNVSLSWFEPGADVREPWNGYVIESLRSASSDGDCNHAGIDVGDINLDGRVDIAFSNGWYETPEDPRAAWPSGSWHPVTTYDAISNTLIRDMNSDGRPDLVTASGHIDDDHDVRWYENPGSGGAQVWTEHVVATLRSPECLQVEDLDGDEDYDIVACDLDWSKWSEETHNVFVFENEGGATSWVATNVAPDSYPAHLLQLADINGDGKLDIVSESTGYSVVTYNENETDDSIPTNREESGSLENDGAGPSLQEVYPNPFGASSVNMRYVIPEAERITLAVYDVMGRLVSKLIDDRVTAGEGTVLWDGADDSGRPVATGVYFVVLEAGRHITNVPLYKLE